MVSPAFAELVERMVDAMGLTLTAVRPVPEGLLLHTSDGFVYAFLEDPTEISLASLERIYGEAESGAPRLVLFTPGRLPLALAAEVSERGSTLVDSARFHELARSLGLEHYLGEEPRASPPGERSRLLPSAQQLDAIMARGRAWLEWGVPALALRFYRQATDLKPGFVPAKVGVSRALLALGLTEDAERMLDEVLTDHPDDVAARLGRAAVLGAKGRPREEISVYRQLLKEDPSRAEARAHLVAALIDLPDWPAAREELNGMLRSTPENPRLRYLYGVSLAKTGHLATAEREWQRARELGLTPESELALAGHAGWKLPSRSSARTRRTHSEHAKGAPKGHAAGAGTVPPETKASHPKTAAGSRRASTAPRRRKRK